MNLENQVCSLELSKRLKELGVKQNGLFYYQNHPYNDGTDDIVIMIREKRNKNNSNCIMNTECEDFEQPSYSAFTVAELGEMLPENNDDFYISHCREDDGQEENLGKWACNFNSMSIRKYDDHNEWANTEADARAKMLIYLIENKLMEVPK